MPELNGFGVLDSIDETAANAPVVLVVSGADRAASSTSWTPGGSTASSESRSIPQDMADVVAACAEIRGRSTFETMALATVMTGAPLDCAVEVVRGHHAVDRRQTRFSTSAIRISIPPEISGPRHGDPCSPAHCRTA